MGQLSKKLFRFDKPENVYWKTQDIVTLWG